MTGWSVHLVVLGALAALGAVLTVLDYTGSSNAGAWISLRGLASTLYWIGFAAFAVASSITFAFLRAHVGVAMSYVAAVFLVVALGWIVWFGTGLIEKPLESRKNERLMSDLASRLTLEAWSMAEQPGGLVRFTVTVRGERDGTVEFEPLAAIGGYVAVDRAQRTSERPLRAGERVVLEATAQRNAPGVFDAVDLLFVSRIPNVETGLITYATGVTQDVIESSMLKRPLPAASAATK